MLVLHPDLRGSAGQVNFALDQEQVAQAPVAGESSDLLVQVGPDVVSQAHQGQFAQVASVGAYAAFAQTARCAAGDGFGFQQQRVFARFREFPGDRAAIDAAADDDIIGHVNVQF